jgi:hypothetical protein
MSDVSSFFIKQLKFGLLYHILQLLHILPHYFSGQNIEKGKEGNARWKRRKGRRGKEHEEGT